jgi:hypothetical protein
MDCLNMFKLSMVFNESCAFPSLAFSEYYIALIIFYCDVFRSDHAYVRFFYSDISYSGSVASF